MNMKQIFAIIFSLIMVTSLTGCPDGLFGDKKDGGGGQVAAAPPTPQDRGGCKYDYSERRYRYEDGSTCSYDEFYDSNACYNYYYDVRWDRYYDEAGNPIDCNTDYIDYNGVIPYYNYNYNLGYSYWGCSGGYQPVPVGFGYFVCAADPATQNGLNRTWWFWLYF